MEEMGASRHRSRSGFRRALQVIYWLSTTALRSKHRDMTLLKQIRQQRVVNRNAAIRLLQEAKPELTRRYGVTRLALFGSTARDQASLGSDIDILVAFDGAATSARYFGVQFYLEDLFGVPVDSVTEKALRPELRPFVEAEAVNV